MQNLVVGEHLSEWHSGYRAYSVATLAELPFERLSPDYNFDTQIILQLHDAGKRIVELPIPTFYGEEISYVNGMKYARQCAIDVARYRAQRMGLGTAEFAFSSVAAEEDETDGLQTDPERVQGRILRSLAGRAPQRILDLGCGDGTLASTLRQQGHTVVGVDRAKRDGVAERVDHFVEADLDSPLPDDVGGGFDTVIAVDVLGFVRDPVALLRDATRRLAPTGRILVGIPNFGHWYPRLRVATGRFDYDRRGILDEDHIRFFTRRSARRAFARAGLEERRMEAVGMPVHLMAKRSIDGRSTRVINAVQRVDAAVADLVPSLFAYQFVFELSSRASGSH